MASRHAPAVQGLCWISTFVLVRSFCPAARANTDEVRSLEHCPFSSGSAIIGLLVALDIHKIGTVS